MTKTNAAAKNETATKAAAVEANGKPAKASPEATPKVKSPVTKPQVRILAALAKATGAMNAKMIAKQASIAASWVTGFTWKACKANSTPSLCEQKLAKEVTIGGKGEDINERGCEITAAGRKLLAKMAK